jgi:alkaline phosphatase
VNIYAAGNPLTREKLRGNHENTQIGHFIKEYLDLDLEAITEILNAHSGEIEGDDIQIEHESGEFLIQNGRFHEHRAI